MDARRASHDLDVLRRVRFQADVEIPGVGVIRCCHSSPRADIETITPGTPLVRLADVTVDVDAERGFDFRTTPYDVNTYIAEMLVTDDPSREAVAKLLREPPTAAEIIDHAESVVFAD
jgi:hypothetical protein